MELSIVLVILGLLVGGILAGQSLIRAAEIRSVNVEYQRFTTAIGTFRDKYFALPGDFNNAVGFWGNTVTGNGNGDGLIQNTSTAIGASAALTSNEISNFWIHLGQAGLTEGAFTAIADVTLTGGTNNPRGKMSGSVWNVIQLGTVAVGGTSSPVAGANVQAASTFYAGNYGNAFLFGTGTSALLPGGILKSEEAWNIDTKMDDGKPDTGSVRTLESQGSASAGSGCGNLATSTSALAASSFDLTNTSATACSLVFKTGY